MITPEMNQGTVANVGFNFKRLPPDLQRHLAKSVDSPIPNCPLEADGIYRGDSRALLNRIAPNSVALSFWSPPYWVGKQYEQYLDFNGWQGLLREVIRKHFRVIKPGGFLGINISDILCFEDSDMPKVQHEVVSRKNSQITAAVVLDALERHPGLNRYKLAKLLGCSEQTIDRRLNGNNIRGGKHKPQTRVKLVGGLVEQWATEAGFYLYDKRIWSKDPCWENSRWHSLSYRAVDESEYIFIFWKPGVTKYDRNRLSPSEWVEWGSRGVWNIPSVRSNSDHEAKFPFELPARMIKMFSDPGEIILDPFIGSGTTAVAAATFSRKFIGIDLEKKYVELAMRNVSNCQPDAACNLPPLSPQP